MSTPGTVRCRMSARAPASVSRVMAAVKGAVALAIFLGLATGAAADDVGFLAQKSRDADEIVAAVNRDGHVRVVVLFQSPVSSDEMKSPDRASIDNIKAQVAATQNAIIAQHFGGAKDPAPGHGFARYLTRFEITPGFAISATLAELESLAADPRVRSINLDRARPPALLQSVGLVGMPNAYVNGATGTGYAVAILDTGVQADHELLNGKVIAQACFSNGNGSGKGVSLCPAGGNDQIGGNAAQPIGQCINGATNLCDHGTHVASIAAGRNPNALQGRPANGVAKDASIFAVQVFTRYNTMADCNPPGTPPPLGPVPCVLSLDSDQVRGLDHVFGQLFLNGSIKVASVNMSIGGGQYKDACDDAVQKPAIDHLRNAGVLTTISSGNDGYNPFVGSPGCISTAVTVGATTKSDVMSSFSNISSLVDLLAPGGFGSGGGPCVFDTLIDDILAAEAGSPTATDSYSCKSGTSMAAPHVAGAIAAIRSACPFLLEGFTPNGATANAIENALKSTGVPVTIPLPPLTPPPGLSGDVTQTKPRIRVDRAVAAACLLPLVVDHDFDGDGKSDILARNIDGSTAIVFISGGALPGFFSPGDNNWQIFGRADFDGDGKSDILWRHSDGTVAIWFMDGGTKVGEAYPGGAGGSNDWKIFATGDFNGDAKSDILWRHIDGTVAIWFMNGGTKVGEAYPAGGGGNNAWKIVATGDFNGDAKSDILWRHSDGTVAIWFMDGGTKVGEAYPGGAGGDNNWKIFATGDFDGDGKSDILWRHSDGTVAIWFMNGGTKVGEAYPGGAGGDNNWKIVGTEDFNGDAKSDILWRHSDGTVAIWFMDGGTISGQAYGGPVNDSWVIEGTAARSGRPAAGDFNGDGKNDILWRHSDGTVAIWFMNGGTKVGEAYPGGAGGDNNWKIFATGDFNGGGKSDILWRHSDGTVAIWFMDGGTKVGEAYPGGAGGDSNWKIFATGDFDGDGKSDILWRYSDGTVAIWFMNGGTKVGEAYPGGAGGDNNWKIFATGDFDGDGKSDILWRHSDGTVAIWFMNGGTKVGEAYPGGAGGDNNWKIVATGDFNGDGKSDILWRHSDGTVAIWFMDGGTKVGEAYPGGAGGDNNWKIFATGDFDGDGKSDILWRHSDGTVAIWFMNGGTKVGEAYPGGAGGDNNWKIQGTAAN